jgi:hypothetical protein
MPKLIVSPTIVQCVGNINKAASEFVGLVNTGDEDISITRVQPPPGWVGIGQYSDYREYRLMLPSLGTRSQSAQSSERYPQSRE